MVTNPVESSNLARVGYDRATGLLRVEFKGGGVAVRRVAVDMFADLMAAPSKGKFWIAHLKGLPDAAAGASSADTGQVPQQPAAAVPAQHSPTLQTYEPDDCCGKPLSKALASGALNAAREWTCPKCGTKWVVCDRHPLRHWEPSVDVVIF